MVSINIIVFLVIGFMLLLQTMRKGTGVIYYLPIYLVVFDGLYMYLEEGNMFGSLRNLVLILFFIVIMKNKYLFLLKKYKFILFMLIFYSGVTYVNSSGSFLQVTNSLILFFFPILLYPIAIISYKSESSFRFISKSSTRALIIFIVFNIIGQIFEIGATQYGGDVFIGFRFEKIFIGVFIILTMPIAFLYYPNNKVLYVVLISLTSVIIIINMVRTTLILLFVSGVIYFLSKKSKISFFLRIIPFIIIGSTLLIMSRDLISSQVETREEKFNKEYSYEKEGRFIETEVILTESIKEKTYILGKEPFNTVGNYNDGKWEDRPIHVDINIIYFSFGLIGLIIYVIFFMIIGREILKNKKYTKFDHKNKDIYIVSILIFVSLVVSSFSGGLLVVSFRGFAFLYLGTIHGYFDKHREMLIYHKNIENRQNENTLANCLSRKHSETRINYNQK